MSAPYPAHLETDVVLRDGSTVSVRPATPADEHLVQDYFIGLSDESRRLRFWATSVDISEAARRTVDVDQVDHITLIATAMMTAPPIRVAIAAGAMTVSTLTRYEAWPIAVLSILIVGLTSQGVWKARIKSSALFGAIAALGPVYWNLFMRRHTPMKFGKAD